MFTNKNNVKCVPSDRILNWITLYEVSELYFLFTMLLVDVPGMEAVLKTEKYHKIKLLHRLIYDEEGNRNSRKRLREFSGFCFEDGSKEFNDKLEKIKKTFGCMN